MSKREIDLYLQDILTSIQRIEEYTNKEDLFTLKEQIKRLL